MNRARILVIDDDELLREALCDFVELKGKHAMDAAGSAREANEKLAACSFDLILLDMGLPDSDGLDLLRTIRSTHAATPVIVLTGDAHKADQAVAGGAFSCVVKPSDPYHLMNEIKRALKR